MNTIRVRGFFDIPEYYTGIVILQTGDKYWYKDGRLHREDGPACEYDDGTNIWCIGYKNYFLISLKNYVVLDYYKGKYDLMWYKLLGKDKVVEYPDIPGLIVK